MDPMHFVARAERRIRALLLRTTFEQEMDEEMRVHLEMEVEDRVLRGMTLSEARSTALRDFGRVDIHKEHARMALGLRLWDETGRDVRSTARALLRSPVFTITAVLSLALGIGATAAFFSVAEPLLLRSLPVHAANELVVLARNPATPTQRFTHPEFERIVGESRTLSGVAALGYDGPVSFRAASGAGPGAAEVARAALVSGTYFGVLGVQPAAGRMLSATDDAEGRSHPYAVLSHRFWQQRFGANPEVVGSDVRINSTVFTVIGVAAAGFDGARVGTTPDLFVPLSMESSVSSVPPPRWNAADRPWLSLIGRRRPGVPDARIVADVSARLVETAREAAPAIAAARAKGLVPPHQPVPDPRAVVLPGGRGVSDLRDTVSRPLVLLWTGAVLLLLIACANVAGLSLARSLSRDRETATRLALGATRGRLVQQELTEGALLSIAAGVIGLGIAYGGARALVGLFPARGAAPALDIALNPRVFAFSLVVSLGAAVLCGLLPALRTSRLELVPTLKRGGTDTGGRGRRLDSRRVLVVGQIALSVVLLVCAGLFMRTIQNLRALELGFAPEQVLAVHVKPAQLGYENGPRLRAYYWSMRERIATTPGVRSVAITDETPLEGHGRQWTAAIAPESASPDDVLPVVDLNTVGKDYFETLGIPLLAGREFQDQDAAEAEDPSGGRMVAIVSASIAERLFPGLSALGRRFSRGDHYLAHESYEVVGVVEDAHYHGLREAPAGMIYLPTDGGPSSMLVIRHAGGPDAVIGAVRRHAAAVDPAVPVADTRTLEAQVGGALAVERFLAILCTAFGVVAALLAAIGLYGVLAESVLRRRREMGIRLALGDSHAGIVRGVLENALALGLLGTMVGGALALALTRVVAHFLYGVDPADPLTLGGAGLLLIAITLLAAAVPAWRAISGNPMMLLRNE